jgi:thymidylate kinase
VIAFVGSEATGKSTLLGEIERRLSEDRTVQDRTVRRIHAGKPPATALTWIPHLLLPALRAMFPSKRSTRIEARHDAKGSAYPIMFLVRSVMVAYERRALLVRAFRWASDGTIVLSDRFPSPGAPDGAQLGDLRTGSVRGLRRRLADLEVRLYRDIAAPDLVIHLTAPLAVTLARNAARPKREPEDYVRRRHSMAEGLVFDEALVRRIDSDRELADTVRDVEGAIRDMLGAALK